MSVVLDDARRLGYAEADPSADIDGDDAAAKIVVLAGIAFRRHLRLGDIPRQSIRPVSGADFRYARSLGCTIRQIAMVETSGDQFHAFVGPALVLRGSNFGLNMGANNVVTIAGHYGGENSFSGPGAGGPATAVAVVSDLLSLTQRTQDRSEEWPAGAVTGAPPRPYYLRFVVYDRPGILASIAAALAGQGINLDAVLQQPGYPEGRAAVRHHRRSRATKRAQGRARRYRPVRVPCRAAAVASDAIGRRRAAVISFLIRVT